MKRLLTTALIMLCLISTTYAERLTSATVRHRDKLYRYLLTPEKTGTTSLLDDAIFGFGNNAATPDVYFQFDGTNFEQFAQAADTPWIIGAVVAGFDITYYFETAGTIAIDYDGDIMTLSKDMSLGFGDTPDWTVNFDDSVDDQLIFLTAGTTCTADTDPMFEIIVGATPDADQQVFGVAKGTQASNTALLTLDEDGDFAVAGSLSISGGDDLLTLSADDVLTFASNDGTSTIQVYGFEAGSAVLSLDADEADDNADTWTFTVADGGALTVANEGTATMTIQEIVSHNDENVTNIGEISVDDIMSDASTDVMWTLKTVVKTIDLDDDGSGTDFTFDDDAGNQTEQSVDLGAIIPAYAEVVSVQLRCYETVTGSTQMAIDLGTASGGAELLASANIDTANDIDGTATGAGPKLEAANAAKNVWINATPGANWDTLDAGLWAVMVTYIDYGAVYTEKTD